MKIISIDPGEKNLAIVLFDAGVFSDFFLGSISDCAKPQQSIAEAHNPHENSLMKTLEKIFERLETSGCVAFIERQRSAKMCWIAGCVAAVCYHRNIPVMKFNPLFKLQLFKQRGSTSKMSHFQNKKLAVDVVNEILTADNCSFLDRFQALKKKDDVADCVLMIHFVLQNPSLKWSSFHQFN